MVAVLPSAVFRRRLGGGPLLAHCSSHAAAQFGAALASRHCSVGGDSLPIDDACLSQRRNRLRPPPAAPIGPLVT
ncbi:hypothetical protein MRX96_030275 [Rhipicephalus microplus]